MWFVLCLGSSCICLHNKENFSSSYMGSGIRYLLCLRLCTIPLPEGTIFGSVSNCRHSDSSCKESTCFFWRWNWFLSAFANNFEISVAEDLNFLRRCFCSLDKITRNCLTMPISAFYFKQTHHLLPPSNFNWVSPSIATRRNSIPLSLYISSSLCFSPLPTKMKNLTESN